MHPKVNLKEEEITPKANLKEEEEEIIQRPT